MARNTGRGSSNAAGHGRGGDWLDNTRPRPLVVWAEPDDVAIYDGEKITATRRWLLTPDEADALADLLRSAAADVRNTR
jgi:hypothetical protein